MKLQLTIKNQVGHNAAPATDPIASSQRVATASLSVLSCTHGSGAWKRRRVFRSADLIGKSSDGRQQAFCRCLIRAHPRGELFDIEKEYD